MLDNLRKAENVHLTPIGNTAWFWGDIRRCVKMCFKAGLPNYKGGKEASLSNGVLQVYLIPRRYVFRKPANNYYLFFLGETSRRRMSPLVSTRPTVPFGIPRLTKVSVLTTAGVVESSLARKSANSSADRAITIAIRSYLPVVQMSWHTAGC